MKTLFFCMLFAICMIRSNAQDPVLGNLSDLCFNGFYKQPIFNDTLGKTSFSIPDLQRMKYLAGLKTNVLLEDKMKHMQTNFPLQGVANFYANDLQKRKLFKDSLLIDSFSSSKFRRISKIGSVKRDLLLRDTDEEVRLIYPSSEKKSLDFGH